MEAYKAAVLQEGDTVIGERSSKVLEPQVSFVIMDQKTGQVKAISGGRGTKTASLTLNRATDTTRQPGSTFKVITAFAPALDTCGLHLEAFTTMLHSLWGQKPLKTGTSRVILATPASATVSSIP